MKIRKFRATDSQTAMRQIRAELGPDAAILACYDVPEGIEFLVTLEDVSVEPARPAQAAPTQAQAVSQTLAARRGLDALVSPGAMRAAAKPPLQQPVAITTLMPQDAAPDAELVSLRAELGTMRHLLESHLRAIMPTGGNPVGFSSALIQAMRSAPSVGPDDAQLSLTERLAAALPVRGEPEAGIVAFVGLAGVGKTSLLARLATQRVMAGQGKDVAIICCDGNRLGAAEQLKAYGRVLQVPVHVAHDAASLGYLLGMLADRRHIFIDTAGLSARDRDAMSALQELLAVCPQADVCLALSADDDPAVIDATVDAFLPLMPTALALTRVDECLRLDGCLAPAIRHRLPLVWLSEHAHQPHAVRCIDVDGLAERAARLAGMPLEQDVAFDPAFSYLDKARA